MKKGAFSARYAVIEKNPRIQKDQSRRACMKLFMLNALYILRTVEDAGELMTGNTDVVAKEAKEQRNLFVAFSLGCQIFYLARV